MIGFDKNWKEQENERKFRFPTMVVVVVCVFSGGDL